MGIEKFLDFHWLSHSFMSISIYPVRGNSYNKNQCKPTDTIQLMDKKGTRILVTNNVEAASNRPVPPFLTLDKANVSATVNRVIERLHVGLTLNELLIVEYYSRKV